MVRQETLTDIKPLANQSSSKIIPEPAIKVHFISYEDMHDVKTKQKLRKHAMQQYHQARKWRRIHGIKNNTGTKVSSPALERGSTSTLRNISPKVKLTSSRSQIHVQADTLKPSKGTGDITWDSSSRTHSQDGSSSSSNQNQETEALAGTPVDPKVPRAETGMIHDRMASVVEWKRALNPLAGLAIDLKPTDQALLQHYLTAIPTLTLGIRFDGLYSPMRDAIFASAMLHSGVFEWMLIFGESSMASLREQPLPLSVTHRKQRAYRYINDTLSKKGCQESDATFALIHAALTVDSRYSSPQILLMHIKGLDFLFHKRGGPPALQGNQLITRIMACTYHMCDGGFVRTYTELQRLNRTFFQSTQDLQNHVKHLSQCRTRQGSPGKNLSASSMLDDNSGKLSRIHLVQCSLFTSVTSPLYPFLHPTHSSDLVQNLSRQNITYYFSILLSLSYTMYDNRHQPDTILAFLQKFQKEIDESSATDPETGKKSINSRALAGMLYKGGFERNHKGGMSNSEFWRTWQVIDGLKILARLSNRWRARLLDALASWIVIHLPTEGFVPSGTEPEEVGNFFLPEEFEEMKTIVLESWTAF